MMSQDVNELHTFMNWDLFAVIQHWDVSKSYSVKCVHGVRWVCLYDVFIVKFFLTSVLIHREAGRRSEVTD